MVVHGFISHSTVNGPGTRAVVFFQGCSLACPGCQNPETHHRKSGTWMSPNELAKLILRQPGITGVTFSGGEPMEQLEDGLDLLVGLLRSERPDLSIGIFTGYTKNELDMGQFRASWNVNTRIPIYKKQEAWGWLATKIDWAVFGRYNQQKPCSDPMRSSLNQNLVCFTDRYTLEDFPAQALELTVSSNGMLAQITGFPQGHVRETTVLGVPSNVCR